MIGPARMLLLVVVLLSGGLTSLWVDKQGQWRHLLWIPPAARAPDAQLPAALTDAAAAQPPETYASVLERPLFAPDRRPPPPPAPPPPPDPLADIKLYGVFSGKTPGIIARIEGKMRRVTVTESVGNWTLQKVEDRTATFARGDEKRELKMNYAPLGERAQSASSNGQSPSGPPPSARFMGTIGAAAAQNQQEENRERLRRRNEIRAAKGLPPVTE